MEQYSFQMSYVDLFKDYVNNHVNIFYDYLLF